MTLGSPQVPLAPVQKNTLLIWELVEFWAKRIFTLLPLRGRGQWQELGGSPTRLKGAKAPEVCQHLSCYQLIFLLLWSTIWTWSKKPSVRTQKFQEGHKLYAHLYVCMFFVFFFFINRLTKIYFLIFYFQFEKKCWLTWLLDVTMSHGFE